MFKSWLAKKRRTQGTTKSVLRTMTSKLKKC